MRYAARTMRNTPNEWPRSFVRAQTLAAVLLAVSGAGTIAQAEKNPWGMVGDPAGGPARVVGFYANGCIAGAGAAEPQAQEQEIDVDAAAFLQGEAGRGDVRGAIECKREVPQRVVGEAGHLEHDLISWTRFDGAKRPFG